MITKNSSTDKRDKKTITITYDGIKIKEIVEKNNINKSKLINSLGYKGNNEYKRLIDEESVLGLAGLIILAKELDCDIYDFLKEEYKNNVPNIEFIEFDNFNSMVDYFYNKEKKYNGRIAILKSFPSVIYQNNESERYKYLQTSNNTEIYSLKGILEFCFSDFTPTSKAEKLRYLSMISNKKHIYNHVFIMKENMFEETATSYELLGNDILITTSVPLHKTAIFIVKSEKLVSKIKAKINRDNFFTDDQTRKLLSILSESIDKNKTIVGFLFKIENADTEIFESILNVVSPDIKEKIHH